MATHGLEEYHRILRRAAFKHFFEFRSALGIEDAFFLKHLEGVGIEHLGPEVGIVAGGIAVVAEDMLEVG